MSCGPPCPPCTPPPPTPCPQISTPPPPPPLPCRPKPILKGLHWAQTKGILFQALALSACAGATYYFLVGRPRMFKYKDYYEKAEFEDWADEMAKKGLFQSVPMGSLVD